MLTEQKINEIINATGVVITKADERHIKGIITDPQSQKKTKFSITWGDDYVTLSIGKNKDEALVKMITDALKIDYIKGEVNTWTGKEIICFWYAKEKERKDTLHSLQVACAMKDGLFSFLGWQDAKLVSA